MHYTENEQKGWHCSLTQASFEKTHLAWRFEGRDGLRERERERERETHTLTVDNKSLFANAEPNSYHGASCCSVVLTVPVPFSNAELLNQN